MSGWGEWELYKRSPDSRCTADGCCRERVSRGLCHMHYLAGWRARKRPNKVPEKVELGCTITGCDKPHAGRGWCVSHYTAWKRHGDPLYKRPTSMTSAAQRLREARKTAPVGEARLCPVCGSAFKVSRTLFACCSKSCSLRLRAWLKEPTWPAIRLKSSVACSLFHLTCSACDQVYVSRYPRGRHRHEGESPHGYAYRGFAERACMRCGGSVPASHKRYAKAVCLACRQAANHSKRRASKQRRKNRLTVARVPYRNQDIFERDGMRCHICGKRCADRKVPHPLAPTVDHLVPLSDGGVDAPVNVATAHFICNSRRGARGVVQLRLAA